MSPTRCPGCYAGYAVDGHRCPGCRIRAARVAAERRRRRAALNDAVRHEIATLLGGTDPDTIAIEAWLLHPQPTQQENPNP